MQVAAVRAALRRRPLALCYHGVGVSSLEHDPGFLRIPPDALRDQVTLLRDAGATFVTASALAEALARGESGAGRVALTFDDGYHDNHAVLAPLLADYGAPATVFVVTGLIGQPNPWLQPGAAERMMTADELLELDAAGIELGAHTVTHPDLATLGEEACLEEIAGSRRVLESLLGHPVTAFAYPFFSAHEPARRAAGRAGLRCAYAGVHGRFEEPFDLPRIMLAGKDRLPSFVLRVTGLYEPWFHSRAGRGLRTSTRSARALVRRLRAR
jgi:peptidoglycan/xylan/chitin deacetylase (PgdA/CDA1 family)